jgi:hypothetical protein
LSALNLSKTCIDRQTLRIEDAEGKLIALWVTHGADVLGTTIDTLPSIVESLFPQELYKEDSRRKGFEFCALHMTVYARYGENVSMDVSFAARVDYFCYREQMRLCIFIRIDSGKRTNQVV